MNGIVKKSTEHIFASFYVDSIEVALKVQSIQEVVNFPHNVIGMPLAPDYLLGIFNLRGMIIPVINLKKLLKIGNEKTSLEQKIGIVEHQGARIGLIFDSTSEILRLKENEISYFDYKEDSKNVVVNGAIKLNGGERLIQIIDPFLLINVENIPQILEKQKGSEQFKKTLYGQSLRDKCITFNVNDMKFAFEITGINEIIKFSEIMGTGSDDGLCIGSVNLRGMTIPVIDFNFLLTSQRYDYEKTDSQRVIVLKVEKSLFGLLVDAVDSINTYVKEELLPIPLFNKIRTQMIAGCVSFSEQENVIMLNHNAILENDEVVRMTKGYSNVYSTNIDNAVSRLKNTGRESYISFKVDHLFGIPIKNIREIIELPESISHAPGANNIVKGILNLRGKVVTVIDTRSLYQMNPKEKTVEANEKILIFEYMNESFGLVVDSIESIISLTDDKRIKVPSLMTQNIRGRFENEIKEIVTYQQKDSKEGILVILNIEPLLEKVKEKAVA